MFDNTEQVIRGLKAFGRSYGTKSRSVIGTGGAGHSFDADPFGNGFIDDIDTRTELLSRFARLDERERAVLAQWYIEDLAVPSICDSLGMSRASCYRIRDAAVAKLTDDASIAASIS